MTTEMITYCSGTMRKAYEQFAHGWSEAFDRVTVYTDDDLPRVSGVTMLRGYRSSDKWRDGIKRKVKCVAAHMATTTADRTVFMDADCCVMDSRVTKVFDLHPFAEVIITRMVNRNNKSGDASGGIIWMKGAGGRLFADEWKAKALRDELWEGQRDNKPAPDQTVLHQMCLDAFDRLKPWTCAVESERVYNGGAEAGSGDIEGFYTSIEKHSPSVIHFKCGWWKDEKIVAKARNLAAKRIAV